MKTSSFFLSTLIAAAAMSANAYAAGDANTILINFASQTDGQGDATWGTWNEIDTVNGNGEVSGENISLVDINGEETSSKLSYSAANTWSDDASGILKGYLDDGNGRGVSISVATSFLVADVTIYCSTDTDSRAFTAKQVNGVFYTYSDTGTIAGSEDWGLSGSSSVEEGVNTLTVSGVSGSAISIYSPGTSSAARGCIAALKIVDAYTGTKKTFGGLSGSVNWTTTQLGSTEGSWVNSTAEAGTYAALSLSEDTTLNVGEGVVTDAVTVAGGGTLTLSGNAITLIGPGTIRADDTETSVVVNTDVLFSGNACVSGNVVFNKSVSISASTLSVSGNLQLGDEAELTTSQLDKGTHDFSSVSGTGSIVYNTVTDNPGYNGGVKVKLSDSFSGDFILNKRIWLSFAKKDSYFGNATVVLSGDALFHSTQTVELANDIRLDGTAEIWADSSNAEVTLSGTISGEGNLVRKGAGKMIFSGNIENLETLSLEGGATNITGSATIDGIAVNSGDLNVTGTTATFNGEGVRQGLYAKSGNITIGDGENATLVSATRLEMGDTNSSGIESDITVKENAILKITGGSLGNAGDTWEGSGNYKTNTVVLGGWSASTTANIAGTLLARDASVGFGDTGGSIAISGELAAKGLGQAGITGGSISISLSDGGKLLLGDNGISSKKENFTISMGAGTVGTYSDSVMTIVKDASLDSTTGTTFDTQKYVFADDGNSVTRGNEAGAISVSGVLSGSGKLIKTGAGTLTLSNANTYSGGTTIEAGTLVAAHQNALGGGNVTMSGGVLKTEQATTLSGNIILGNGKAVSLELAGDLTVGWVGVSADNDKASSINIDFGTDGKIVAGYKSNYGGGINFTDSDDVTFTIVSTTEADTYSSVAVSDLVGRVLLSATNGASVAEKGVNGIWNLAESSGTMNALKIVVENALGATLLDATATFVNNNDGTFTWFDSQSGLELLLSQSSLANGESTLTILSVPEPSAFGLLAGLGAVALCVSRRRRSRR